MPDGGPHLSAAHHLTCFMTLFEPYKRCLKNASVRLSMVPSIRSRRVVPNGGPHLSVAHNLACFMKAFNLV